MDVLNDVILNMVNEGNSITEMHDQTFLSVGEVHKRLVKLQDQGLIYPPPKPHQARARKLTPWGHTYLQNAGYEAVKLFG